MSKPSDRESTNKRVGGDVERIEKESQEFEEGEDEDATEGEHTLACVVLEWVSLRIRYTLWRQPPAFRAEILPEHAAEARLSSFSIAVSPLIVTI